MQIRETLKTLAAEERKLNVQILKYLLEVDSQKLYLDWGFGSLFSYVTQELFYSEASASRRIAAMRLLRQDQSLEEKLKSGTLSLSNAAQVQSVIRQIKTTTPSERDSLVRAVENKSTREAEKALLHAAQIIEPKFVPLSRESLRATSEQTLSLKINISHELEAKLQKLKELLSHKNPNLSYAELLEILADRALKALDPMKKPAPTPSFLAAQIPKTKNRRFIPAATRRHVWQAAEGRCSYQDPGTQRRCESRHLLEIDHRVPLAWGGSSSAQNLRLLCRAHNQREAARLGLLGTKHRRRGGCFSEGGLRPASGEIERSFSP